jgi:hypothetical protein
MKLQHPGFEFMVGDLITSLPRADPRLLVDACARADLVCHLVLAVPSIEVVCGALNLFRAEADTAPTAEERAVFSTASDWAGQILDQFHRRVLT